LLETETKLCSLQIVLPTADRAEETCSKSNVLDILKWYTSCSPIRVKLFDDQSQNIRKHGNTCRTIFSSMFISSN